MSDILDSAVTVNEAARMLRVSPSTIWRAIKARARLPRQPWHTRSGTPLKRPIAGRMRWPSAVS